MKNRLPVQETRVRSLCREDPLEEGMATHSSILAWRIPRTEEPGGSVGHKESEATQVTWHARPRQASQQAVSAGQYLEEYSERSEELSTRSRSRVETSGCSFSFLPATGKKSISLRAAQNAWEKYVWLDCILRKGNQSLFRLIFSSAVQSNHTLEPESTPPPR